MRLVEESGVNDEVHGSFARIRFDGELCFVMPTLRTRRVDRALVEKLGFERPISI